MTDFLPAWPLLGAFVAASLVLAVTPGPAVFYIVTRSVAQGRRSGLASVAGVAVGNLGNAVGAALGLAALFAVSSIAFTVVKYVGALYLVYLGVQALRTKPAAMDAAATLAPVRLARIVRDGLVVALLNPKTALFFAAFLPQFVDAPSSPVRQTLALGGTFVLVASVTDSLYAIAAGTVRPWLARARGARRAGRYLTGGAFIGLGVLAAFTDHRPRA